MQGDLSHIGVADLTAHIFLSNLTGVLRLYKGTVRKNLYFIKGRVVFAHSNLLNEKLGQILLNLGKIGEDLFATLSRELGSGRRLGQILQDKAGLTQVEVASAVHYQLQKIAYSIFNWDAGTFEFEEKARPVHEDIIVEVSTPELIVGGIRNITNAEVLKRAVGDQTIVPVRATGAPSIQWSDWSHTEETVHNLVDGVLQVEELRSRTNMPSIEFSRALYALSICGVISLGTDAIYGKKRVPDGASLSDRVVPQNIPARHTEEEIRELVEMATMKFLEATDREVLNLPAFASIELIQHHYDYLTGVFHPCYYSPDQYHDLKHQLKFIVDRLSEAYQNLLDKTAGEAQKGNFVQNVEDHELLPIMEWWKKSDTSKVPSPEDADPSPPPESFYLESARENKRRTTDPAREAAKRRLKALSLLDTGKPRDAEKELLSALELNLKDIETHFALAHLYHSQGLKFKAFKHFNKILQLDPENQKVTELLGLKPRKRILFEISNHKD